MNKKVPSSDDVKLIYRDTYLLYTKFKDINDFDDFGTLLKSAYELEKLYPFDITRKLIVELVDVIELQWKSRNGILD